MTESKFDRLAKAAKVYGERSFDNYAQIRSVAEQIRDGLSAWLGTDEPCVFLVPPQGAFSAQNYRSAAYSVSGKGFLPLEPISFGLAINISGHGDYMRLILTCRKEGNRMFVTVDNRNTCEIRLPVEEDRMETFFEDIFDYLHRWFTDRVAQYDDGNYGSNDIGFDIHHVDD
ncbi:MAG: hypothetical protein GDA39_04180 [Hyphomonadaceae bacterium]|nr:hypothetical protein [Hyphomonadaceae bacterium]MBC6412133.1 hypothetical protein [Hyphomonadaceae bacterium]